MGGEGWGEHDIEIERLVCDGRVFLVLAANGCGGGSASGGLTFSGQFHARDGRQIAWSCNTWDGITGSAKVDGQRFDLRKGGLLLIATDDEKTKVREFLEKSKPEFQR